MSMLISNPLGFAADCIHSGDYTGAEQACRQILDRDPAVGDAWFVLGVASQLLGKVAQSVIYYRNSVRLAPGNPEAWNNLGASLSALRRPDEAEPCLRGLWSSSPPMPRPTTTWATPCRCRGGSMGPSMRTTAPTLQAGLCRGLRSRRPGLAMPGADRRGH